MNKNLTITIVAVLLLAGGVGGYFAFGRSSSSPSSNSSEAANTTPAQDSMQKKSLKDLMGLGTNQQCTFKDATGNGGTVYVSGTKVRGDFASTTNGTSISSHMVSDGKTTYMWMDGQTQGFKTSLDAVAQPDLTAKQQPAVDVNQQLDYNCGAWTVNASVFALPTGIDFIDPAALMPKVTLPAGSAAQCAACDSLTGTYRDQCLATLNCN